MADTQPTPEYSELPPTGAIAPKKKRGVLKILLIIVGVLVAALVALLGIGFLVQDDPSVAVAGNCVHNSGTDDKPNVGIVDCKAGNADFKVLKVISGDDDHKCDGIDGLEAAYVEKAGADAFVLCLGKNS